MSTVKTKITFDANHYDENLTSSVIHRQRKQKQLYM